MSEFSDFMSDGFRETAQTVSSDGTSTTLTFEGKTADGVLGEFKTGREMRSAGVIPTFDDVFTLLLADFTPLGITHESSVTIGTRTLRVKDISYHNVFVNLGLKEVR